MLNRIRDRFGTAGLVVSVVALVFALAGGAFAASGGLNAKQKKQVKAIAKSFQGTGPAGPAGPQGLQGTAGTNGTNGADGADGKTVLSGTATPTAGTGTLGDFYIETDVQKIYGPKAGAGPNGGWGNGTDLQGADGADGAEGSPWVVGSAPSGAVLKGAWSTHSSNAAADETLPTTFTFGVPLGANYIVDIVPPGGPDPAAALFGQPICTGDATDPTPATGPGAGQAVVCAYATSLTNLTLPGQGSLNFLGAQLTATPGGNVVATKATAAGLAEAYGSWAVQVP